MRQHLNWWFNLSFVIIFSVILTQGIDFWNFNYAEFFLKTSFNYSWVLSNSYWWIGSSTVSILYLLLLGALFTYYFKGIFFIIIILFMLLENRMPLIGRDANHIWSDDFFWFNSLLTNHLNHIHPPLFFITGFLLLFFMVHLEQTRTNLKYYGYLYNSDLLLYALQLVVFPLLLLGGWWAYQEGNWGGWWNWDPSETLALMMALIFLCRLHYPFYLSSIISERNRNLRSYSFVLMIFFFIQLNFAALSHNFGMKFLAFFSGHISLLWGELISVMGVIFFLKKSYWTWFSKITTSRYKFPRYGGLTMFIFITLYVGYSFSSLWTFFMWEFGKGIGGDIGYGIECINWMGGLLLILNIVRITYLIGFIGAGGGAELGWSGFGIFGGMGPLFKLKDFHLPIIWGILGCICGVYVEMWLQEDGVGRLTIFTDNIARIYLEWGESLWRIRLEGWGGGRIASTPDGTVPVICSSILGLVWLLWENKIFRKKRA